MVSNVNELMLENTSSKYPLKQDLTANLAVALIECQAFDGLRGYGHDISVKTLGSCSTPFSSEGRVI